MEDVAAAPILPLAYMARRLRVPASWLKAEAEASRVPCLRAGRGFLFNPEAVERVLAQRAAADPTASMAAVKAG
jgi:hypothetical protein